MRYKEPLEQGVYLREASQQGRLELVYATLDSLGSTPWIVNRAIFDVVLKVWNSGQRFLKLPPAEFEKPMPIITPEEEKDPKLKVKYMEKLKDWNHEKGNCHSQRCSVNYKLEIARSVCLLH